MLGNGKLYNITTRRDGSLAIRIGMPTDLYHDERNMVENFRPRELMRFVSASTYVIGLQQMYRNNDRRSKPIRRSIAK